MRTVLIVAAFLMLPTPAPAETWIAREGECGEWESRFEVEQERSGIWIGTIEHRQVGAACARSTGRVLRSEVRAGIVGDNLFAVRRTGKTTCTYFAQLHYNAGEGFVFCERGERGTFKVQFQRERSRGWETPPDELPSPNQSSPLPSETREP